MWKRITRFGSRREEDNKIYKDLTTGTFVPIFLKIHVCFKYNKDIISKV
jgi:hypothetical protein